MASSIRVDARTQASMTDMLATALGPAICAALRDDDVTDIAVNADGSIWIDAHGVDRMRQPERIARADAERAIRLVATYSGAECHKSAPIVSAELPSGARFEGILPPVSEGPIFSIRRPAPQIYRLDRYVVDGVMSADQANALQQAVRARKSILVAGGTGSGKTTLLNALLAEIASLHERIVILEDTRELRCELRDCVHLRTKAEVASLRALVRATLRLRPDRIVVGEVRGGEALDLLKAWNTGHPGGLASIHANSPHAALLRLEQLIEEAVPRASKALIAEAVDIVAFLDGRGAERRLGGLVSVGGATSDGLYQLKSLMD